MDITYWREERKFKKFCFKIPKGISVVEVFLAENTLIEPKTDMGRPLNDQFPFMNDNEFHQNNRFVKFDRVKKVVIDKVDSHE